MKEENWDFYVDTGGTFTDCLGRGSNGRLERAKVLSRGSLSAEVISYLEEGCMALSEDPGWPKDFPIGFKIFTGSGKPSRRVLSWEPKSKILRTDQPFDKEDQRLGSIELHSDWEAPILGMRLILARSGIAPNSVRVRMRLATTRCTNALLEDSGRRPVLFVTSGFSDLLEIGDQRRTDLFDPVPQKRPHLHGQVIEVEERIDRTGKILQPPNLDRVRERACRLLEEGQTSAVVSLLNSYRNPDHERQVAELLRELGFAKVVESFGTHPFMKWLPRCESAVIEAYLAPILEQYLDRVQEGLGERGELKIMTSSGGLLDRSQYRSIDSLLSGPAGGVVGAANLARSAAVTHFINLDMGGTSADVSRHSGQFSYQPEHRIGQAKVSGSALRIETIAAGGGSICSVENGLLKVGPKSAGAHPGPACYGFGGPFCLTDANLLLGRLDPRKFSTPIDPTASESRLGELIELSGRNRDDLLFGFLAVSDDAMANAIRKVSVEQGYDPADHALVTYGGAGGQHACGVASRLGVKRILSPADSGLLSAFGLSKARIERILERQVLGPIDPHEISKIEKEMLAEGIASVEKAGDRGELIGKTASIRLAGQEATLEFHDYRAEELAGAFREKFTKIFGYFPEGKELELHSLRVRVGGEEPESAKETFPETVCGQVKSAEFRIHRRDELQPGDRLIGPCLVSDEFGALWIDKGWQGVMGSRRTVSLHRQISENPYASPFFKFAKTELFTSRFLCLVEEMGAQLERTALSVNVRERLDFSCALLDKSGRLVANAPHIPVHLGAMGLCVRKMLREAVSMEEGDLMISNHPGYGGSHLPDVTVMLPVFGDSGNPVAYLANRAHHAEIGGIVPGSMPAGATNLSEEGVVISPFFLFRAGNSQFAEIEKLLSSGPYPSRQPGENMADLSAQVASLRCGAEAMSGLLDEYGEDEITHHLQALTEAASASCRKFLKSLGNEEIVAEQFLDDGDRLSLKVSIFDEQAIFDFCGTSPVRTDNLNANEAIVHSVLAYCMRLLVGSDLPLNEGLLEPLRIMIPRNCLLAPDFSREPELCPGVAGGNVEISQRLTDLVLHAFGKVACSQGTMNNLTFGNDHFSHYETVGGGSGACVGQAGTSAVQVHMTNTAITDPEVLEARFPVRLLRFVRRRGSGGEGAWTGGEGIEREYLFENSVSLSILSQRRREGPDGLAGGRAGQPGEQILIRKDGSRESVQGSQSLAIEAGDRFLLRTPGGGGAGKPELLA